MAHPAGTRLYLMAPLEIQVGERYETLWDEIRASGYVRVRVDGQTYSIDELPAIDRRRKHDVEVVVDRVTVRPDARAASPAAWRTPCRWAAACCAWPIRATTCPSRSGRSKSHSQHFACDRCGRSFEPLSPHNFSFNSSLGWCPACEGLGTQTGANPAALLRDPKLTLAQGAVALWPGADSRAVRGDARRPFAAARAFRPTCPSTSSAAATAG